MHPTYLRYELLRNVRNWRFVVFSVAYPVVLYFVVPRPNVTPRSMVSRSRCTSWPAWRPSER
jgi:hypothetical protein